MGVHDEQGAEDRVGDGVQRAGGEGRDGEGDQASGDESGALLVGNLVCSVCPCLLSLGRTGRIVMRS